MFAPDPTKPFFPLLSRDEFRNVVFARDSHVCVNCGAPAVDAHHILDRKLFPDGGYYKANGASVCSPCHLLAESTELSCETLRQKAGIKQFPLPPQLSEGQSYDKWGNPTLPNGQRLRGEMFYDAAVQKILQPVLSLFTDKVKYPRTYHLPWSPGVTDDDRVMPSLHAFQGNEVVITVKMDGENTTVYSDYVHARSINYEPHASRTRVKALQATIAADIPKGWRICGENVFAKHSIAYRNLKDYFLVFSIWNEANMCLSWAETVEYAQLLGLHTVPVLYQGLWDEKAVRRLAPAQHDGDPCEGYVVRVADSFTYAQFRTRVGKYVRANHVQTQEHWQYSRMEPNIVVTN